jgi:hypothetical protein
MALSTPIPPCSSLTHVPHGLALRLALLGVLLLTTAVAAHAGDRLTATGGIATVEGAGGGGLTPWALISGSGTEDQIGGSVHATQIEMTDFRLKETGVAVGIDDRLELSLSRLCFQLGSTVPGDAIREDVVGIKLKLTGDAVFEPDTWRPQLAIGAEYKHNLDAIPVPRAIGARRDADVDYYLAATKLWFAAAAGHNVLGNLTLRATRANQLGLLGFGGDRNDSYQWQPEASLAVFVRDDLVAGLEYRHKPDNLSAFSEGSFYDTFLAWFPAKEVSVTAAYTHLGTIADKRDQRGLFLQLQLNR